MSIAPTIALTAANIASMVQGVVVGNDQQAVTGIQRIDGASNNDVTFLNSEAYRKFLSITHAGIILISEAVWQIEQSIGSQKHTDKMTTPTLVVVPDAYRAFVVVMQHFFPPLTMSAGLRHPTATIHKTAEVHPTACIGPGCAIDAGSVISQNVMLYANVTVYENVTIGANTIVHANAVLGAGTSIGERCIIHPGAVLGADGFGFLENADGSFDKIPHVGTVVLGDLVEVGANTTIDRAAVGDTAGLCGWTHRIADQAIAIEIHGEGISAAQHDMTGLRADQSAVGDARRRQHDRAAAGGVDLAVVDDLAIAAAREIVAAGHEILIGQVRCGGEKAADIDAGVVAQQHPVGIEQPHLAVAADCAVDVRDGRTGHLVQGDGAGIGLVELDAGALPDRKILPVDDGFRRALVHHRCGAGGQDLGLAGHHRSADRLSTGLRQAQRQEWNYACCFKDIPANARRQARFFRDFNSTHDIPPGPAQYREPPKAARSPRNIAPASREEARATRNVL